MLRPTQYDGAETASLLRAAQESATRAELKPYTRSKSIFVTLISGTVNIPHGLKRKPAGWLLHSILGSSAVYVATAPDTAIIPITATALGSCIIEVW